MGSAAVKFEIEPPEKAPQFEVEPPEKPGFLARASERILGTQHPIDQAVSEAHDLWHDPVGTSGRAIKQIVGNPIQAAKQWATHPAQTAIDLTGGETFAEDVHNKNYRGALGNLAGNAALVGTASPEARAAVSRPIAPTVRGIGKVGSAATDMVNPDVTGIISPRLAHAQRLGGRVFERMEDYRPQAKPVPLAPSPFQLRGIQADGPPGPSVRGLLPPAVFEAPASPVRPQLALTEGSPRDIIAANPGERGLQMARGGRMTEPMVLPSESRGLMLPERGGLVPRGVRAPDPTSRLINSISQQAVRGAGGTPETPTPPTPGKPIVSRPTPPPTVQNLAQDVPEMIPANSSALKGYHYDPAKQVMTVETRSGGMYRYAEVTPDEFRAFEDSDSTGKAFHELKNNHVQTEANYGKGWIRKIPSQRSSEAPTEGGLVPVLEESVRRARAKAGK